MGALSQVVNAAVLAALIALAGTFFKSWSEQKSGQPQTVFVKTARTLF